MEINSKSDVYQHPDPQPITVGKQEYEYFDTFTFLGSILYQNGGIDQDIKARIGRGRAVFIKLSQVWKSTAYSRSTNLWICQSCVFSVLLYALECWRMTDYDLKELSSFYTGCLRKIMWILQTNKISNTEVHERTGEEKIESIFKKGRKRQLRHVLRKEAHDITKNSNEVDTWRSKNDMARTIEEALVEEHLKWGTAERPAQDHQR